MTFAGDSYRTLREISSASIKVERSEFIALAFPCRDESELRQRLTATGKEYFDATHHCWAYRLFDDGNQRSRSSDAGEPSGTAGKPILTTIESNDLYDAGVIVVRYYGGVKLGTGGLARAYRSATAEVLNHASVRVTILYETISVTVPFSAMSLAYRLASPPDILLAGEEFGETNRFRFEVRRSRVAEFRRMLSEKNLISEG